MQASQRENRGISVGELAHIRAELELFGKELQEWREFLDEARTQWRLPSDQVARIQAWGSRSMMGPDGREIPFLTTDELQNLTISTGTLTEKEWADMRTHVSQSEAYLQRIPWSDDLKDVPCIAGAHHEKLDGSGYPLGLKADELSYRVRILTVADIFDAATAWDRPYCLPLSVDRAARLLERMAERGKLDGDLVELFNQQVLPGLSDLIPVRTGATGTEADVTPDL
jgi:hypothetical protein